MTKVFTNKPGFYGVGSVEFSPSASPGEGPVRRIAITQDKLVTQPLEGIETVYDIVSYAARTHGNRNAIGWRDIVKVVEEEKEVKKIVDGKETVEKKKWKFFELSDYKYMNYIDVQTAASEISRAFISFGLSKGDVFSVYAQTRYGVQLSSCFMILNRLLLAPIGNSCSMVVPPFQ
jgi:long-chain acyl-CoA synthetase